MKNLLILGHSPDIGGAELALKGLVDSINSNFNITIIIPSTKKANSSIVNKGVEYINLDLPWWCYESHGSPTLVLEKEMMSNFNRLMSIASKNDILMTNTLTVPWLAFAASRLNIPHIWYVHEFGDLDHGLKFVLGYEKSLSVINDTSSRVLTISDAVRKHITNVINNEKIDIIHQAINLDELKKIEIIREPGKTRFLFMGSIKASKGQQIAVDAIKLLIKDGYNVSLDIAGPPTNIDYLKKLEQSSKGYGEIAIKVGFYDIVNEMKTHDILLMCSENEALGRVTIEAMASGLEVVGYASPSTSYLLGEGRGILYEKNDSLTLYKTLKDVIKKNKKANTQSAKKFVMETYNSNVQAKDFIDCFEKAMNSNKLARLNDPFNEYVDQLKADNLLTNNGPGIHMKARKKIIGFIPSQIKKPLKKILKKFR